MKKLLVLITVILCTLVSNIDAQAKSPTGYSIQFPANEKISTISEDSIINILFEVNEVSLDCADRFSIKCAVEADELFEGIIDWYTVEINGWLYIIERTNYSFVLYMIGLEYHKHWPSAIKYLLADKVKIGQTVVIYSEVSTERLIPEGFERTKSIDDTDPRDNYRYHYCKRTK